MLGLKYVQLQNTILFALTHKKTNIVILANFKKF